LKRPCASVVALRGAGGLSAHAFEESFLFQHDLHAGRWLALPSTVSDDRGPFAQPQFVQLLAGRQTREKAPSAVTDAHVNF